MSSKITDLTAITTPDNADLLPVVDVSDTAMDASGTNKKWTIANMLTFLASSFGNVYKTGTPVNNQVAVWTADGIVEGDVDLTFDTSTNTLAVAPIGLDGSLVTHKVRSDASDGLIMEANNGTDVGLLGTANTANVTWYGTHNFDVATQDTIAGFTGAGKSLGSLATATYPSLTELSYVKGVTSAVQTQINAKAPTASPSFTGTVTLPTGLTGVIRADSGVVSVDTDVTDIVTAASDTTAGKIEIATTAETNTGTDATRAVSPDGLSQSYAGQKAVSILVFDGTTDVSTGDGKAYITIPAALNGMNLIRAQATVVTAGTTNATTVMIHNKTDTQDMLSGAISIASAGTVGTVGTINTTYDDVATNDILRIDVDSVSTTAPKGLMVVLEFGLP